MNYSGGRAEILTVYCPLWGRNNSKKQAMPWQLPQMGNFGQKHQDFGALPDCPSACQADGAHGGGLVVLRPVLACGSSWCPRAWELHQPLPPYHSPCAAEGPENTPCSCSLLYSRPDNLISHHLPSPCCPDPTCSPSPSSEPFASHWDAGPGARVVPKWHPCPSPSATHCHLHWRGHG